MRVKIKFRQSVLAYDMQRIFHTNDINKILYYSIFLSAFFAPSVFAQTTAHQDPQKDDNTSPTLTHTATIDASQTTAKVLSAAEQQLDLNTKISPSEGVAANAARVDSSDQIDSMALLQQQSPPNPVVKFTPIEFDDLESLPVNSIDPAMANEIYAAADEAKRQAETMRNEAARMPEMSIKDSTVQELTEITRAPVNVDQLMQSIQADSKIEVEPNRKGITLNDRGVDDPDAVEKKLNFAQRLIQKIRPSKGGIVDEKISVVIEGAPPLMAKNIKAQLASFSTETFSDYSAAIPQLRLLSNQAAQAVGYYGAQFKFEKLSDDKVKINVQPGDPVIVQQSNFELFGAGAKLPQFQVINVLPDLLVGDILNQGYYEKTKARIVEAASNNGFFDSYWRLHDVKVNLPEDTADINVRFETGERYKLDAVEFRMSDPSKPLPINLDVLESMVPWKAGADYTAWRVNAFANSLTNSRYFNYTLVDTIKPDPITKALEHPDDIQALIDEQRVTEQQLAAQDIKTVAPVASKHEVTQNVVDEKQFAGTTVAPEMSRAMQVSNDENEQAESETEYLKQQARETKRIPVIVTLNADQLNSLETGLGYGTDTGVRLRSQYRRAIVNRYGHSFDANLELSQIRQAIDGRYSIPYHHPLNDYISLVGGYEREDRDNIGQDMNLVIESAVLGADRIIKGAGKDWQHIFGTRYRLDRVTQQGVVDTSDIPDAFLIPGAQPQQQSLLFGYELSKIDANQRLNPTRGFRQLYRVQLGSEALISDANMAIVEAKWKALYSVGENDDYQFIGSANLGYIFANDFVKVPYNLRYFAGGDQSIRGFDYKSLSPIEYGYKVGGQALAVGSVEFNYQFKEGWRAAVFSDFGNAYDKDFSNKTEYSVGAGIRWSSPIGPVRLDLASGISQEGSPIRLIIFIGSLL